VKEEIFFLAVAVSFAMILLLGDVYPFTSSNFNLAQAQQMMTAPPTVSPAPNNTQTIAIILIAVAAVAIVAVALYLVYSRSLKEATAHAGTPHVYTSGNTGPSPMQPQKTSTKEASKPFEVFLCYKKSSGKDYADHLKSGLEEVGLHTFEDCKDIPQAVETEEGWSRFRDKALAESKYFVLIMTPGFDLSSEVVKEIGMARKQANKTFVFFRHRSMGRKILVNLGDEVLDIGQLEQVSFESKEELLRLAINILLKGGAQ
jgi:hypothetical protein